MKGIELLARISKPGQANYSHRPNVQLGVDRQRQKVNAFGRNVLADVARGKIETKGCQFVEQFSVNQMHLAKVRLQRILSNT